MQGTWPSPRPDNEALRLRLSTEHGSWMEAVFSPLIAILQIRRLWNRTHEDTEPALDQTDLG